RRVLFRSSCRPILGSRGCSQGPFGLRRVEWNQPARSRWRVGSRCRSQAAQTRWAVANRTMLVRLGKFFHAGRIDTEEEVRSEVDVLDAIALRGFHYCFVIPAVPGQQGDVYPCVTHLLY